MYPVSLRMHCVRNLKKKWHVKKMFGQFQAEVLVWNKNSYSIEIYFLTDRNCLPMAIKVRLQDENGNGRIM
jgi:hypothetical protein